MLFCSALKSFSNPKACLSDVVTAVTTEDDFFVLFSSLFIFKSCCHLCLFFPGRDCPSASPSPQSVVVWLAIEFTRVHMTSLAHEPYIPLKNVLLTGFSKNDSLFSVAFEIQVGLMW